MEQNAAKVLSVLERFGATSVPELMALTDLTDSEVEVVLESLESAGLIRVKDEGSLNSIITAREKAIQNARRTGSI